MDLKIDHVFSLVSNNNPPGLETDKLPDLHGVIPPGLETSSSSKKSPHLHGDVPLARNWMDASNQSVDEEYNALISQQGAAGVNDVVDGDEPTSKDVLGPDLMGALTVTLESPGPELIDVCEATCEPLGSSRRDSGLADLDVPPFLSCEEGFTGQRSEMGATLDSSLEAMGPPVLQPEKGKYLHLYCCSS